MKKKLLFTVLTLFILVGCNKKPTPLEEILSEIEFGFLEGDNFEHITGDFTITRTSKIYDEAMLFWDLSNIEYAKIENETVIITRPDDEDFELTLSLTVVYNNEEISKDYQFILKYEEGEIVIPPDPIKPDQPPITYYQITYKDDTKTLKRERYEKGSTIVLTEIPTKEGFTFYGWLYNKEIVEEVTLTKNITLTAVFNNDIFARDDKDEEAVLNDLDEIYVLNYFFDKEKMNWPTKGVRGSVASYEILDSEHLKYFNFSKNEVTPPKDEYIKTKILIKLKKGESEITKEISAYLGQPPLIEIGEIKNVEDEMFIKTSGIITGSYVENKIEHYYLQDDQDGVLLLAESNHALPNNLVADFILYLSPDGLVIMTYEIKNKKHEIEKPFIYSEENFNANLHKLVYLEGIVTKGIENKSFEIYLNKKYNVSIKANQTANVKAMTYVSFYGFITKINDDIVIVIVEPETIESSNLDNVEITDIIMEALNFSSSIITLNSNLTLPSTDRIFNSVITWTADNDAEIKNGVLIKPSDKSEIKLIAHIKLNNSKTLKREFKVIINN